MRDLGEAGTRAAGSVMPGCCGKSREVRVGVAVWTRENKVSELTRRGSGPLIETPLWGWWLVYGCGRSCWRMWIRGVMWSDVLFEGALWRHARGGSVAQTAVPVHATFNTSLRRHLFIVFVVVHVLRGGVRVYVTLVWIQEGGSGLSLHVFRGKNKLSHLFLK